MGRMQHGPWSRRRFLRGAAGAALALPLLELCDAKVARALPFPTRLVIVFTPNGTVQPSWDPTGGETDFTLGTILGPLDGFHDDLLILGGIDVESSYHGPGDGMHINGMAHLLTGTEMVDKGFGDYWGGGISVDQFIAKQIGQSTRFGSLEFAVEPCPANARGRLSYLGAAQPVPPEESPKDAWERIFGAITPERIAQRKSVLDAVGADMAGLGARLGKGDREKVEAHLDAVREIEKRIDIPASCEVTPLDPTLGSDFVTTGKVQMDLLVRALACDLTRVATFVWAPSTSNLVFSWLDIAEGHHSLSHSIPSDAASQLKLIQINRWYATQIAYLLSAMKAVPEGDGTLLDHSVVLWCNELSDGEIHARRGMPFVMAGSAGGYFKTGRSLQFGSAMQGAFHNDLLVSLCNAMGVPAQSFGNPAYCKGPLAGLTG